MTRILTIAVITFAVLLAIWAANGSFNPFDWMEWVNP